jgi:glycosyltransferase involved in cell wall biosynthesis
LIERRVLANAAAVHFTSEQEKLEAELSAPGTPSFIIPNPVAISERNSGSRGGAFRGRFPELAGRRVILFLSRLDPKKGLELLLDGFGRVRAAFPHVTLVIAGSGEDSFVRHLQEKAQRLGVHRDVIWAGFLEGEMKQAAFEAAEVFALPSYSENFGIAVVEAMAWGLPVVVSDQVAIHRDITRDKAGIVVRCDAGEISGALVKMLGDSGMRTEMARNSLRLATKFSPEAVGGRLIEMYGQLSAESAAVRHFPATDHEAISHR